MTVEFVVQDEAGQRVHLTTEDISCITAAADGLRLAAKIVDMPCSEMDTHTFIQVGGYYLHVLQMFVYVHQR